MTKVQCPICKGTGGISDREKNDFEFLSFIIPKEALPVIKSEINRITEIAQLTTDRPAVRRGLALEYMAVLSSQTPAESLQ